MFFHYTGNASASVGSNRLSEFRKNITLDKKDFAAIEYLLRKGRRQLEIYSAPGVRNIMK
ncbi:MAG: hypothetical protein M1824_000538 [Vezdaea acicularis]|nr:MAG: hypothetical protein M1824_000538 [Vezdaea acicularis]